MAHWTSTKAVVGSENLVSDVGKAGALPREIYREASDTEIEIKHSGNLYFGIDNYLPRDNRGQLQVEVIVSKRSK